MHRKRRSFVFHRTSFLNGALELTEAQWEENPRGPLIILLTLKFRTERGEDMRMVRLDPAKRWIIDPIIDDPAIERLMREATEGLTDAVNEAMKD